MQRRYFLKLSAAGAASLLWSDDGARRGGLAPPASVRSDVRMRLQRPESFTAFDALGSSFEIQPLGGRIVERGPLGVALRQIGSFGVERGQLNHPIGLGFGPDNQMYVVDHGNHRIQVFDALGHYLREISGLRAPRGLAFDAAGNLWVADTLNHRVAVFDRDGTLLSQLGELGSSPGRFNAPASLAFAPNGELHVLDYGNRRVQVFDRLGALAGLYGDGRLGSGRSLALAADGSVYIADSHNGAIEVFGPDGSYQRPLTPWFPDGSSAVPVHLAFAPTGDLHIAAVRGTKQRRQLT
jgi:tripartite motif-containing protein 71